MSEAIQIALIAAGIPAAVTLVLYSGRLVDWWLARREKRREERAREADQEEARRTTRVLLETIELKNEELAMKNRRISDLLRDRETNQRRIAHLETLLDGSRR